MKVQTKKRLNYRYRWRLREITEVAKASNFNTHFYSHQFKAVSMFFDCFFFIFILWIYFSVVPVAVAVFPPATAVMFFSNGVHPGQKTLDTFNSISECMDCINCFIFFYWSKTKVWPLLLTYPWSWLNGLVLLGYTDTVSCCIYTLHSYIVTCYLNKVDMSTKNSHVKGWTMKNEEEGTVFNVKHPQTWL